MTDDIPTSMAEAMAEIRRLRVRVMEYEARAAELEVRLAVQRKASADIAQIAMTGSLAKPTPDEPATYTRNVPPSAPPHDK